MTISTATMRRLALILVSVGSIACGRENHYMVTIKDEAGKIVPGAEVRWVSRDEWSEADTGQSGDFQANLEDWLTNHGTAQTSDGSGQLMVPLLPGVIFAQVRAGPLFGSGSLHHGSIMDERPFDERAETLTVRKDIQARIKVVDQDGKPVSGVRVTHTVGVGDLVDLGGGYWVTDSAGLVVVKHAQTLPHRAFPQDTDFFELAIPLAVRAATVIDPAATDDYERTLVLPQCGSFVFEFEDPLGDNLQWQGVLNGDPPRKPAAWDWGWPFIEGRAYTVPHVGLGFAFEYHLGLAALSGAHVRFDGPTKPGEVVHVRVPAR